VCVCVCEKDTKFYTVRTMTSDVASGPTCFNPCSQWEEHVEVKGLTMYDIHRKPRTRDPDAKSTVNIRLPALNTELTCPICLGILRDTMLVMECAHRFCSECIQKCLRTGKKECPACRMHVPSRRSLRRDENYDAFISKIYPDLDAFEDDEGKYIANINQTQNVKNAFTESVQLGIKAQEESRKKWRWKLAHRKKFEDDEEKKESIEKERKRKKRTYTRKKRSQKGEESVATRTVSQKKKRPYTRKIVPPDSTVWFVLTPHPHEKLIPSLPRALLGSNALLTAWHMKQYIVKNLPMPVALDCLKLTIPVLGHDGNVSEVVVDDSQTLEEVARLNATSKKALRPPVLHFQSVETKHD